MRNLDILAAESGEHVRVLLCREEQSYVVSCQHFRMPYPVASDLLAELQPVPAETYSVFVLDEDITNRQREGRNRKLDLIAPLLEDACIYDKSHRNEVVRQIAAEHGIARRTVLQYLWRYWVYQSKNALLPAERPAPEQHELTADEKAIRWALNKYYYTPQRQSLQTAYKMMLRAKYCDARGTLKAEYPTFWQFRYFFRKNRDPISETISRQGLKAYQRNHRPFTGSVCDYAHTIGVYMTDATVADIYIVSRLSRKPIGRPIIYTMVDAYSRLITGVYVGLEGGQYALRLLLQNTFTDKVSFCHQHGIDIDPQDWPSHHLPTKIMTDRGSEFVAGTLENLCESYHIEIENLPAYRPDLKGVVEKLFDLIQSAYKPLLKGKGVIESNTQERDAPDYRRQGILDLEQFTAVVLRCVLFYNAKSVQTGFTRIPAMIEANTPPLAASIWSFCEAQDDCPVKEATDKKLLYNPFIEALPPMLSGKDLIHALAVIPPYNDSDRDRSTGERLQLLSSLYEFYQPLSMTIDLYCEIYTAMQHCYGQYSPQSEAAAFQNGYSLMHGNALAASIGGGNSFSVVGVSGLGKSTALQRVLSLYPQVIEHTEYHGQKFYCHQISYLVVQTPHDASIKALILDIYLQIDSLIGTTYQKDALSRRLSIQYL